MIGQVLAHDQVSIWYGAVVRGDVNKVKIGPVTTVQDRAVVQAVSSLESGFGADVNIGGYCTIEKGAILTSCILEDNVQIGAGAIVAEGSVIGRNAVISAGAVVEAGTLVGANEFWAGNPAKFVRTVEEEESGTFEKLAVATAELAQEHAAEFLPHGFAYVKAEKLL